jgi:hypothetical protein
LSDPWLFGVALSMMFSVSNKSARSQDSPMLWLCVLAGSLAFHLIVILVGRWYLSQPAGGRVGGGAQAPLDFVEIDPNAPPLKQAVTPSASAPENAAIPKSAEAPEAPESGKASIENFTRQTPERSPTETRQSPEPVKPVQPDLRSNPSAQPVQPTRPSDPLQPKSNSPTRPTNSQKPEPTSKPNSPSDAVPAKPEPFKPTPRDDDKPAVDKPGTPSQDQVQEPVESGNDLTGQGSGQFTGSMSDLQVDPNAKQDDGALSVTFAITEIPPIALPIKAPNQMLDVRVAVEIDNVEGTIIGVKLLDDSPSLRADPNLRDDANTIVNSLLVAPDPANPDKPRRLFNVKVKPVTNPPVTTPRIMRMQINSTGKVVRVSP